ncbi:MULTISPECIES: orotidine-5'-phosphate decarboxylase [unclassified Microbacterium]|uniref:orotidine-5'-phosphate decarboxylase n=1 Tax=unclassified Microbacterium TaxID=2609290 RepID=UPI001D5DB2C2|nr:orotidine-5'-phosphate decarboxylase [Actinomycetota bacterium]MBS1899705.1 orotidine-5'-phosphate decarboxylase [Actinomycetota bacterium]
MNEGFGSRLRSALDRHGPLCVGIDPHAALLDSWGLPQSAEGVRAFGLAVVDAAAGRVAAIKPQVAFFERFGSAGFAALEDVLAAARSAELLTIADAKRGDIGTTMAGYAQAWLEPGAPLEADALTISPYLGGGSLAEAITQALPVGKGVFVLAATSNPDGASVQQARTDVPGETVALRVTRDVTALDVAGTALGSVGLVVGATIDRSAFALDDDTLRTVPLLAPGFGAQGATPADLRARFGTLAGNVLASESRSILSAGPDGIAATIEERAARYQEVMGG